MLVGDVTEYDFSDEEGLVVNAADLLKKPAVAKPTVAKKPSTFLGLPKALALTLGGAMILLGGYLVLSKKPRRRSSRVVTNPSADENGDVSRAKRFSESFHWGIPARRVTRQSVSPPPRVGVKLGTLEAVTYRTNKRGESAKLFFHEFEGRKPTLVMDERNKRLHVVGGGYTVTSRGIER